MTGPGTLEHWKTLCSDDAGAARLLEAVAAVDVTDAAAMTRLRRDGDADRVRVAIELVRARRKAERKFPNADTLAADVVGVEQATSHVVAEHKAARFAALAPGEAVLDLCCGIGGDAMSLARRAPVTAVDSDPVRAWMAGHNAGCHAVTDDVKRLDPEGALVHLDPSRRTDAGARTWRYADYVPGPDFIERLLARCPDGAVKLGPGVDLGEIPASGAREIEIINEGGTLVQTVLWCGRLAAHAGARTATRLPEGLTFSGAPETAGFEPSDDALGRFLLVLDPAIERSDLGAALCRDLSVVEVHPGLGLLTSDACPGSPWLTAYEILATMPWRPERLRAWLREHGAGIVTVKTRGGAVDTDDAQRRLRGNGNEPFVVFGLRLGQRVLGVVTRPSS